MNKKSKYYSLIISSAGLLGAFAAVLYFNHYLTLSALVLVILSFVEFILGTCFHHTLLNFSGLFGASWFGSIALSVLRVHVIQKEWRIETWICLILAYIFFNNGLWIIEGKHIRNEKNDHPFLINKMIFIVLLLSIGAFFFEAYHFKYIPLFSSDMAAYQKFHITGIHYFTVTSALLLPLSIISMICDHKQFHWFDWVLNLCACFVSIIMPILIVSRNLFIMTILIGGFAVIKESHIKRRRILFEIVVLAISLGLIGVGWKTLSHYRNQNDAYLRQALNMDNNATFVENPEGQEEIQIQTVPPEVEEKESNIQNVPGFKVSIGKEGITAKNADIEMSPKAMQLYMYIACNYDNFDRNVGNLKRYTFGTKSFFPVFALTGLKFVFPSVSEHKLIQMLPTYTTYPYVMDQYQDFGILGIVIMNILIGMFCKWIAKSSEDHIVSEITFFLCLYSLVLSFFMNGFSNATNWFYVIYLEILYLFLNYLEKKHES